MKYRYYMNDKPMKAEDVKKEYGAKILDTMIRSLGYKPKGEKKDTA